jgi:hypothetical protein
MQIVPLRPTCAASPGQASSSRRLGNGRHHILVNNAGASAWGVRRRPDDFRRCDHGKLPLHSLRQGRHPAHATRGGGTISTSMAPPSKPFLHTPGSACMGDPDVQLPSSWAR